MEPFSQQDNPRILQRQYNSISQMQHHQNAHRNGAQVPAANSATQSPYRLPRLRQLNKSARVQQPQSSDLLDGARYLEELRAGLPFHIQQPTELQESELERLRLDIDTLAQAVRWLVERQNSETAIEMAYSEPQNDILQNESFLR